VAVNFGKSAEAEARRWIDGCIASLCSQYQERGHPLVTLGVDTLELCDHDWCKGIVDVLRRTVGPSLYGAKR